MHKNRNDSEYAFTNFRFNHLIGFAPIYDLELS
jgi:hypothetical protein